MLIALAGIPLGWYGGSTDPYQAHLDRAARATAAGDRDAAIESLLAALRHCEAEFDPGDPCRLELRAGLAELLIEQGQRGEAAALLSEALAIEVEDASAAARARATAQTVLESILRDERRADAPAVPTVPTTDDLLLRSQAPAGVTAPAPSPTDRRGLQALLERGDLRRFADAVRDLDPNAAQALAATDLRRGYADALALLEREGDLDGAAWFAAALLDSLASTPAASRVSAEDQPRLWHLALLRVQSARRDFDGASEHLRFLIADADTNRLEWRDPVYEAIVASIEAFSDGAGRAGRHDLAGAALEELDASIDARIPPSATLSAPDALRLARVAKGLRDAGLYDGAAARHAQILRSARERGVDEASLLELRLDEARARWCRDGGQSAILQELARLAFAERGADDPGPGAILPITSRLNAVQANLGLGRIESASADLAGVNSAILRTVGRDHPFWLDATALSAVIAQRSGRWSEAADRAAEALLLAERLGGPLHPRRVEMLALLAEARRALGDPTAAASLDAEREAIEAWRSQRADQRG